MRTTFARLHHWIVFLLGGLSVVLGVINWASIGVYVVFLFLPWVIHPVTDVYEAWNIMELWEGMMTMAVISLAVGMLFIVVPLGLFGALFFFLGRGLMHNARWARWAGALLCLAMVGLHVMGIQEKPDYAVTNATFIVLYSVIAMIVIVPVRPAGAADQTPSLPGGTSENPKEGVENGVE